MTEDRVVELADVYFGIGRYNKDDVKGFAQACEGEGISWASRVMHKVYDERKARRQRAKRPKP